MLPPAHPRWFLGRLRPWTDAGETERVERWLATARIALAVGSLMAVALDATKPSRYATLTYFLLLLYVLYSAFLLLWLRFRQAATPRFASLTLAVDLVWVTIITLFTQGPDSPFFVFFTFVLLTAAYRWGFRETLRTAVGAAALLLGEVALLSAVPEHFRQFVPGEFSLHEFIIRASYLLLMGFLIGYLAEGEKRRRAETAFVARLLARVQVKSGLRRTLRMFFREILRLYGAKKVLAVLREKSSGRTYSWEMHRSPEDPEVLQLTSELHPAQQEAYLTAPCAHTWHVVRRGSWPGITSEFLALDGEGRRIHDSDSSCTLPDSLLKLHQFRSLAATTFTLGEEWQGRLLVFDASLGVDRLTELSFLQKLMREVGPAMYNVYLVRRLRSQAGNLERARIARELHDTAIQSLIAAEMEVEVLRRQAANGSARTSAPLGRIQEIIHKEVLNLRDVVERIKPVELTPRQLLDFLSDLVEKFRRETGIYTRFFHEAEEMVVSPRVCRELARIVQEGLVNVRKHSGARSVLVWLGRDNSRWKIVIRDDGRGFDFSGRLSQAELAARGTGPAVIQERVRAIGGELTIDSAPGRGASVEVAVPVEPDG